MNRLLIAFTVVAILGARGWAAASESGDALLDRLTGQWVMNGTIAGRQVTHDVSADWELNRGYLRIHEISREKSPSGAPAYEAIIYLSSDPKSGDYTCLWLDTTSNQGLDAQGLAHARRVGDSLPWVWRDANGRVSIENTFLYEPASDSWQWSIDNVEAERRKPFARLTLVKRPGGAGP